MSGDFVPLFELDYGAAEEEAALRVLRRRWLTMGEETEALEAEMAAYLGVPHAIAVGSGTAALHMAVLAAGVRPGDEVIVPSLTFVATANSVAYAGATPVFADVSSLSDPCISPADVERRITSRTRAVTVVHYAGYACDMRAILAIARQHQLAVIEDVGPPVGGSPPAPQLGAQGGLGWI